jgi:hypothetical protein
LASRFDAAFGGIGVWQIGPQTRGQLILDWYFIIHGTGTYLTRQPAHRALIRICPPTRPSSGIGIVAASDTSPTPHPHIEHVHDWRDTSTSQDILSKIAEEGSLPFQSREFSFRVAQWVRRPLAPLRHGLWQPHW